MGCLRRLRGGLCCKRIAGTQCSRNLRPRTSRPARGAGDRARRANKMRPVPEFHIDGQLLHTACSSCAMRAPWPAQHPTGTCVSRPQPVGFNAGPLPLRFAALPRSGPARGARAANCARFAGSRRRSALVHFATGSLDGAGEENSFGRPLDRIEGRANGHGIDRRLRPLSVRFRSAQGDRRRANLARPRVSLRGLALAGARVECRREGPR